MLFPRPVQIPVYKGQNPTDFRIQKGKNWDESVSTDRISQIPMFLEITDPSVDNGPNGTTVLARVLIKPPYTALTISGGAEMKRNEPVGTESICSGVYEWNQQRKKAI